MSFFNQLINGVELNCTLGAGSGSNSEVHGVVRGAVRNFKVFNTEDTGYHGVNLDSRALFRCNSAGGDPGAIEKSPGFRRGSMERFSVNLVDVHLLTQRQRRLGDVLALEYVRRRWYAFGMQLNIGDGSGRTGDLHP